jgi:hypothetical protein
MEWTWWGTDHRVEGAAGTVFLRRGATVYCVEGVDHPDLDLRDLVVDPTRPPAEAFGVRVAGPGAARLHHPVAATGPEPDLPPVPVQLIAYRDWANRGATTMRLRFPTR